MAIKTISQFDAAMPASNDKILFEQNGEGKSTTIGNAVNTCSLTYEEIMASTDLARKIVSASALKIVDSYLGNLKFVYQHNVRVNFPNSTESDRVTAPDNAILIMSVCSNDSGGSWTFVKYLNTFRIKHTDGGTFNTAFYMDIVWACIR